VYLSVDKFGRIIQKTQEMVGDGSGKYLVLKLGGDM
jgi:hypothetical protein